MTVKKSPPPTAPAGDAVLAQLEAALAAVDAEVRVAYARFMQLGAARAKLKKALAAAQAAPPLPDRPVLPGKPGHA